MSIADGLSSNSVYTIFQDSYGVLWFGTIDGLNRYDGYSITVYRHNNLKKSSLSNNRVTLIYEDRQRQLWLYDEFSSTLIRYISAKDEFKTYYLDKVVNNDLETLDSIYEDKSGTLFVQSNTGFNLRYDKEKDRFEALKRDSIPGTAIVDWTKKKEWQKLLTAFNQYLLNSGSTFNTKNIVVNKIFRDSENRYWIATRLDGLYSVTEKNGSFQFTSHLHTSEKFELINSDDIYDIYEDQSNVVWIGTKNNGLYRYSRYKYKFEHIEDIQLSDRTFHLGTLRAITQDADKNIWVGTNDRGLLRIDATKRTGRLFTIDPENIKSVGHRFIRSLWIDSDQNLWIGHYKGFSKYRKSSEDFTQYFPQTDNDEEARVYDFKSGKNNSIWMAGWDLILNFTPGKNQYKMISKSKSPELDFSNENIRDLELDNNQELWIAVGEKGMSLYDKSKKQFSTFHYTPDNSNTLPSNNIFDVFKDSYHNIWLSTADGLCLFNPLKMTFKTYTVNEGLPSNLVYGMMEDKNGNLWFSTTKGIGRLDPSNKTFRNYDISDGLQSNEFSENAFYQNDESTMFFGGINGLTIFHPDSVPDNPNPPKVSITNIRFFDKPHSEVELFDESDIKQKLLNQEEIIITPEYRSISFEFVALHYVNPQKNKYAYMLEGFDETWTYRDANVRFANYTNLEPGSYYFKVKAANSDGVWSKEYTQLKLTIKPPFYATWWFISMSVFIIIVAGIFAYRKRIAMVRKQQSMKSIQLESELNFLKSQVNPHFLFNTLNNIYALCQVNSKNAAPMVGKISEMMRYMIYDCNADLVPLQKEIEYLQNYIDLNQLKSNRKLNASMHIEGNTEGLKIAPLLLINFLENSFKHGDINLNGDGFIRTELIVNNLELFLTIENSFRETHPSSNNQKGIGLENVKHRLSLLYPKRHSLRINKNNRIFEIELKLQLN
ncbi:MAG TPA: two-component regulator propeller domain-containing protein [Cyclobacteriaceae bacterium]|nr:two-component regulator propeller domain-containing protein [Cyclobacteriaceae bacterium]